MFLMEFSPLVQELMQQPAAFLGGFVSGMLRVSLADDPVKSWLDQQARTTYYREPSHSHNGNGGGPQSISIE